MVDLPTPPLHDATSTTFFTSRKPVAAAADAARVSSCGAMATMVALTLLTHGSAATNSSLFCFVSPFRSGAPSSS